MRRNLIIILDILSVDLPKVAFAVVFQVSVRLLEFPHLPLCFPCWIPGLRMGLVGGRIVLDGFQRAEGECDGVFYDAPNGCAEREGQGAAKYG